MVSNVIPHLINTINVIGVSELFPTPAKHGFVVFFEAHLSNIPAPGTPSDISVALARDEADVVQLLERRTSVKNDLEERAAASEARRPVVNFPGVALEHDSPQLGSVQVLKGGKLRSVDVQPLQTLGLDHNLVRRAVENVEGFQLLEALDELLHHCLPVVPPPHLLLQLHDRVEGQGEEEQVAEVAEQLDAAKSAICVAHKISVCHELPQGFGRAFDQVRDDVLQDNNIAMVHQPG